MYIKNLFVKDEFVCSYATHGMYKIISLSDTLIQPYDTFIFDNTMVHMDVQSNTRIGPKNHVWVKFKNNHLHPILLKKGNILQRLVY